MIPLENIAAILLCAGLSRRFGERDKLLAPLHGKPLVRHAADSIASLPLQDRVAIVSSDEVAGLLLPAGYRIVRNHEPETGREASLRIGLRAALASKPDAVLVCLGDMPHVAADHLQALASAAGTRTAAVSQAAGAAHFSPPLLLPRTLAQAILASPDTPARAVISGWSDLATVTAPPLALADIDTQEDLAHAL